MSDATDIHDLDAFAASIGSEPAANLVVQWPLPERLRPMFVDDDHRHHHGEVISGSAYLDQLLDLIARRGSEFTLNLRGSLDLAELAMFEAVQRLRLSASALTNARLLGQFEKLRHLELSVFHIDDAGLFDALRDDQLETLSMNEVPTPEPDLAPLARQRTLRTLYLRGHQKGIAALAGLPALQRLHLAPLKKIDLGFIASLAALKRLELYLGSHTDLEDLREHEGLEELSLGYIRGLADIGPMGRFPALRTLNIERQAKLTRIALGPNPSLEHVSLDTMKQLDTVDGLEGLPTLKSFSSVDTGLALETLQLPDSVDHLHFPPKAYRDLDKRKAEISAMGYIPEWDERARSRYA